MQQCEMKWAAANWMTAIVSKYFLYNFIDTIYILAKRKIRMSLTILKMEMTTKRIILHIPVLGQLSSSPASSMAADFISIVKTEKSEKQN